MADEPDKPADDSPPSKSGMGDPPAEGSPEAPERDWLFGPEEPPEAGTEPPPAEPPPTLPLDLPSPEEEFDSAPEPEPEGEPRGEPERAPEPELIFEPLVAPAPTPPPPLPGGSSPRARVKAPRRRRGLLSRLFILLVAVVFVIPTVMVGLYRFVPPPATALMVIRAVEGQGWDYRWRPLSQVSPALVQSLVAAEDARFCEHRGFDLEAIEKARRNNLRRPGRMRGGSTISQQTAKNVFLWPARSYVRKGLEAYFTILIETLWGKRRIMEVYLNVAEWGPGVYGAEAAAHRWFGKDADQLTRSEASRLAAILPSPLKWKAAASGPYVKKRARRIGAASGTVRNDGLAACV